VTQTKKQSALEAATNIVVSINQNLFITFIFFVVSFVRGYTLRRIFNNLSAANQRKSGKNGKGRGVLKQKGKEKSNVCADKFTHVQN
jgi:hypothetical protein